jgi:NTE family protein
VTFIFCKARLWTAFALISFSAAAQQASVPPLTPVQPGQPKIGLVLEGGAALGLAHIGVITWLEENRIPVYYIAGTSMGGLVGGLYATGNSPTQIRTLIKGIDWPVVLRGEVPFGDLSFRRKEDVEDFPNSLEFGIKQGVRFPSGFNSGHQVGLILDRIALPYSQVNDFDELPIPFACVATDLVNNKAHIFRGGSLSVALRSTMSLPGIFTPVKAEKTVLVDGGLLDNLPVDVAQQLGADLTIAVHLETRPLGANEPLSSVGVLGRSISVVIAANELASMQKADILISVPLANYESTDYEKNEEIIQLGYEAAKSKAALLSRFSLDEPTWQAYLAQRDARRKTTPVPQSIAVTGTNPIMVKGVQSQLADFVGKPIDTSKLEKKLTNLLGDGRFASAGYQIIGTESQPGLQISARESEYSPPSVRPLLVIDGAQVERVQFMLGARITFMDMGRFGTEWRNDIILGSKHGLQSEFYFPFGKELRWFIAPRLFAAKATQDFYKKGDLVSEYRDQIGGGGASFGFVPTRNSQLDVSYFDGYQKLTPIIASLPFGTLTGRNSKSSFDFALDRRNNPIIPTTGHEVRGTAAWQISNPGATSGFPVVALQLSKYLPISASNSLIITAIGGSTFNYHKTGFPPFDIGGGPELYAYGRNEFLANQYFFFRTGLLHKLFSLPTLLGDRAYLVTVAEGAKIYGLPASNSTSSLPGDISGAILMNTIFGPVSVGGGYGATGHLKVFYQIGKSF